MKLTEVYFERQFVLGQHGGNVPEKFRIGIRYTLEADETLESVEDFAIDRLYAAAERERKRRWTRLKEWQKEERLQRRELEQAAKTLKQTALESKGK